MTAGCREFTSFLIAGCIIVAFFIYSEELIITVMFYFIAIKKPLY